MYAGVVADDPPAPNGLLAERGVQITRRVTGTNDPKRRIKHLPSPPKVLVVVASELTDPNIRAGAEYLGLLRALKRENKVLNTRLIIAATANDLTRAIRKFQPNVVHIIGHGVSSGGKPVVLFRPEQPTDRNDPVGAERLLGLLRPAQELSLPGLVVLNACAPTPLEEVSVGRPMAAELVAGGIPVVVGMSGNVADQACRLFTRSFYNSLLDGDEIAKAAAIGRRAGILYGGYDIGMQIDWALPTLYMAEAIGAVSIDKTAQDPDMKRLLAALEFTMEPDYPPFCGRWDFIAKYRDVVSAGGAQFLLIPVPRADSTTGETEAPPRFGSERLLKELAAEALRDGHIPILVSKKWLTREDHRWPKDHLEFIALIWRAVQLTLSKLTSIPEHSTLNELPTASLTRQLLPDPPEASPLPNEFGQLGLGPEQKLAKAMMLDLLELRELVCAQLGCKPEDEVKVVLFVEDVHDLAFANAFLELFRSFGFGDARAREHTRAVMTYHTLPVGIEQTQTLDVIKSFVQSNNVELMELGTLHPAFSETSSIEDEPAFQTAALIYRQFLMGWRQEDKAKPTPLAVASRGTRDRELMSLIAESTQQGVPGKLKSGEARATINSIRRLAAEARLANDDDAIDADKERVKAAAAAAGGQ
jgi:hypothetical protein